MSSIDQLDLKNIYDYIGVILTMQGWFDIHKYNNILLYVYTSRIADGNVK